MVPLKDFRPDIKMSVGNVHEPIIDRAISGAAIEFCDKTRLWSEELNPLVLTPEISEYELDYDCITRVLIGLTEVYIDGAHLAPVPLANLNKMVRDWRSKTALKPTNYYLSEPNKIQLYPAPNADASGELTFRGSFKPHRKSTELPDFIYNDYYDAIVAGAEYRLHSMKGKSWYSPNDAMESKQVFNGYVDDGKIRSRKSRTNGTVKLRIRSAA